MNFQKKLTITLECGLIKNNIMSTKIYNAFIFNGSGEELITILKEIKSEYYELLKNKLTKLNFGWILTKKRYPFLPSDVNWKEFKALDFSDYLLEDIIEKEKKIGEHHPLNIDASVVVYFCEDKIFLQFFGLPNDFQKLVLNKYTQFKDYHYQNSTDQSNYDWDKEPWESMTKERQLELENEWNERYRIWNKIMPGYSAPSENGLYFEFAPINYQLNVLCHDILKSII